MTTNSNFISFNNVSYTYPAISSDLDKDGNQIIPKPVFDYFSANLPSGFVHLVGPNACGKSTLLLLASGRLKPQSGVVTLFNQDPTALDEEDRNKLASFIYQNMELETEENVQSLFEQVLSNSVKFPSSSNNPSLIKDLISEFELKNILNHKLIQLSKGELQRVLVVFALLYNSKSIFMDEPLFAMETKHKELVLDYLGDYSAKKGIPIYISMHDIDLTKKYAENVLLMFPNRDMELGSPEEVLLPESLEKAYGVPAAMLRESEDLNRKNMREAAEVNQQVLRSLYKQ